MKKLVLVVGLGLLSLSVNAQKIPKFKKGIVFDYNSYEKYFLDLRESPKNNPENMLILYDFNQNGKPDVVSYHKIIRERGMGGANFKYQTNATAKEIRVDKNEDGEIDYSLVDFDSYTLINTLGYKNTLETKIKYKNGKPNITKKIRKKMQKYKLYWKKSNTKNKKINYKKI